jgi:hypothetical protein
MDKGFFETWINRTPSLHTGMTWDLRYLTLPDFDQMKEKLANSMNVNTKYVPSITTWLVFLPTPEMKSQRYVLLYALATDLFQSSMSQSDKGCMKLILFPLPI